MKYNIVISTNPVLKIIKRKKAKEKIQHKHQDSTMWNFYFFYNNVKTIKAKWNWDEHWCLLVLFYSCIYFLCFNSNFPPSVCSLFCSANNAKPLTHKDTVTVEVRVDFNEVRSIQFELPNDSIASIPKFCPIYLLASWGSWSCFQAPKPNYTIEYSKERKKKS